MSDPVESLRNLGPRSAEWLESIGIRNRTDIESLGSVQIYAILKGQGMPVSLNLVYALEATLLDLDWRELPQERKAELKYETMRLVAKRG